MNTCTKQILHLTILWVAIVLLTGCQTQAAVPPTAAPTAAPTQVMAEVATVPPAPTATQVPPTQAPAPAKNAISSKLLLDPALAADADSLKISQYLYEGLVRLDANGKPEAALAESWVVSDDQLDYIFTLRSGVAFSDDTSADKSANPINPDAVVANFNRWFDPQDALHGKGDYAAWKRLFLGFHGEKDANNIPVSPVDGIQKVDKNTVLIHLNRQIPDLLTALADPAFAVLSPKALASGAYGDSKSTIVSSGPYVVKSWTDQGLTLSPNPNYWGKAASGDLEFTWR